MIPTFLTTSANRSCMHTWAGRPESCTITVCMHMWLSGHISMYSWGYACRHVVSYACIHEGKCSSICSSIWISAQYEYQAYITHHKILVRIIQTYVRACLRVGDVCIYAVYTNADTSYTNLIKHIPTRTLRVCCLCIQNTVGVLSTHVCFFICARSWSDKVFSLFILGT